MTLSLDTVCRLTVLQVPSDGRLYRQKRVCETLMSLWGTSHSHLAATSSSSAAALSAAAAAVEHGAGGQRGLDGCIARVMCQAVRLPGLSGHLIRSAGLLPWLACTAVLAVQPASTLTGCPAAAAAAAPNMLGQQHPLWAFSCLQQLLAGRLGLSHSREQQQVAAVFAAYCQAVVHVAAAALRPQAAGLLSGAGAAYGSLSSMASSSTWQLQQLLGLLLLLVKAAPSVRAGRQLKQQLEFALWQQLSAAVSGVRQDAGGSMELLQLWRQLSAALAVL